jgi:hypothetical protein
MHSWPKKPRLPGKGFLFMAILLWFPVALFPEPARGENFMEVLDHGRIDWTNRFIEAFGVGRPPADPLNAAHARAVAEREANGAARKNLMALVKNLRIDSETRVADRVAAKEISGEALETLLREARTVDLSYGRDEEVQVRVSLRLQGVLADLLLPKDILIITTVRQPQEAGQKEEPFSGLLVDCKGLSLKPGMVPLLVDEDGAVLYGPAFASRDHAVERGLVSYMRNMSSAKSDPRVGPNPLSVKAVRTVEGRPCDIIISHADAAKLRGLAGNLTLLHQCRVILVMD